MSDIDMTNTNLSTSDEDTLYIVTTATTVINKYLIKSSSPEKIRENINDKLENLDFSEISQTHSIEDIVDIRETSISLAIQESDWYIKDRVEDFITEI